MKPVRAGDLRRQVNLLAKTVTRSASGAEVPTWTTVATVWASIEPAATQRGRGSEFFDSQQINATIDVTISIRYRSGVKPSWRVQYGSRLYDIKAVANIEERNALLVLLCTEGITNSSSPN